MEEKYQRKLQILMKNEGLSQSRLAEMLEVKSSTLSHILAGRNYPGFDMLQKLRRLFPHINADWLLLDTSEDYLADTSSASTASDRPSNGNAPDDAATMSTREALGNTPRQSGSTAGRTAATTSSRGNATIPGSAAGAVGSTGSVGDNAQRMATTPSLFDVPFSSNVSSAGTDATSSTVSAQMLSSFDRADGVRIRRIIVLYEDNSFESFTPRP